MEDLDTCELMGKQPAAPLKVTYPEGYWLNDCERRSEFKDMVQLAHSKFDSVKIYQKEDGTVELQLVGGVNVLRLNFGMDFPYSPPVLHAAKGSDFKKCNAHAEWNMEEGLVVTFEKYLETIEL